jgi:hypothetical protein
MDEDLQSTGDESIEPLVLDEVDLYRGNIDARGAEQRMVFSISVSRISETPWAEARPGSTSKTTVRINRR